MTDISSIGEFEPKLAKEKLRFPKKTRNSDGTLRLNRFHEMKSRERIIEALRLGSTRKAAYESAGVSEVTFYDWLKHENGFKSEVLKAEAHCENRCTTAVQSFVGKDWKAAAWWLERRRKEDYAQRAELTGKNGEPITLSVQEKEQIVKIFPNLSDGANNSGPIALAG